MISSSLSLLRSSSPPHPQLLSHSYENKQVNKRVKKEYIKTNEQKGIKKRN